MPKIAIFSRFPEAGRAKTRLIPALGAVGAADVHRKLAERTVQAARASGMLIELRYTGADKAAFRSWLGDDLAYVEQGDGDLGARMQRASEGAPVIFLGTDCPDLTARHLHNVAKALETAEVVIGPAEDGGYWTLGLAAPQAFLFEEMAWGTEQVLPETLNRLGARGIAPVMLETLADCDRPEDLARWPELAP